MSIALESSGNRIEGTGFIRGMSSCVSIFDAADSGRQIVAGVGPQDRRFPATDRAEDGVQEASSSGSSIGRNSDCSSGSDGEDLEIQSSYKCPLDSMDALEDSLPIRRGISNFYRGKSKSFTSLADAVASSAEDLAKPENPYNRKRKNLLASSGIRDRTHNHPLTNSSSGGISKRPTNSSRSTLSIAIATSSPESNSGDEREPRLPPLPPHGKSSLNRSLPQLAFSSRSYSLTDLHEAGTGSSIVQQKHKRFD